ncbi:MAG: exodeoxyribonuclease VII large subunit [Ruminococcus flavefaciens]|nr:exodeoxyribonuclease VII large subunit [Ruminococcus flavefaciens]MCM1229722.1 exodeoxyribonuclease VII large subunit [Ruminococcus flavefaciens]
MDIITVSQINIYIGSVVKGDNNLKNILIRGEISNYVHHRSGHRYFSLKDSTSAIKAVMFRSYADRLAFAPENGMSVIATGTVTVYEPSGVYQINVTDIVPEGAGKESTALEQLKKKLDGEGIFAQEHKLPLPRMPRKIGVVTSLTGAAVRDIINVLTRRYPLCELYAVNATVQGENAPESVCRGLVLAETAGCDVIIVGRGGGSSEDLSAFNTESVARAIYNCKVPVISAVGHEIDFTIADLVADRRAPTPSAAAELASPTKDDLLGLVNNFASRAEYAMAEILGKSAEKLDMLDKRLALQSPENRIRIMEEKLDGLNKRAESAINRRIDRAESALRENVGRLESLSPLKVMSRGYSLVYSGNALVRDSADLSEGGTVVIKFDKGSAEAEVKKIW